MKTILRPLGLLFLALLLFAPASASADALPPVKNWKTFTAKSSPKFKMAFPGRVSKNSHKTTREYSSRLKVDDGATIQVAVNASPLKSDARELDPKKASTVFTEGRAGKVTGQRISKTPDGFILTFSVIGTSEELISLSLHNIHVRGKAVYQVSYTVVFSETPTRERIDQLFNPALEAMKRFRKL